MRAFGYILTKSPDPQPEWPSGAPPGTANPGSVFDPGHQSKGHHVPRGWCACLGSSPALGGAPAACFCFFF